MSDFSVLHICSWYPTPCRPHHGIFHKHHILSASLYSHQIVIYVSFCPSTNKRKIIENHLPNFSEYICLIPKKKDFYIIPFLRFFQWTKGYFSLIKTIRNKYSNIRLVHLHTVFPAGIIYLLSSTLGKFPLIASEHWSGYLPQDGNYKGYLRKTLTRKVFIRIVKLFVASDRLGKQLIQLKLCHYYELLENVVSPYFLNTPLPLKKRTALNFVRFLHVSTLTDREKNIKGMLHAFSELKKENILNFELIIAGGDEATLQHFKNYSRLLDISDCIRWLGTVEHKQLPDVYAQADAMVLFSHFESQPVVVLEAWAMGIPVLCTPVGQLTVWMKDTMGACSESHNTSDIVKLLKQTPDIIARANPNEMRMFVLHNFTSEKVGKKLYSAYQNIVYQKNKSFTNYH